jgi:hypothetical protein
MALRLYLLYSTLLQAPQYGGSEFWKSNSGGVKHSHEGKLYISIPPQCCLVFRQHYG